MKRKDFQIKNTNESIENKNNQLKRVNLLEQVLIEI